MRPNDIQDDPLIAALLELRTYDVSPARAERLRTRWHNRLPTQDSSRHLPGSSDGGAWPRAVRVIVGAWCAVYLFETIRRAAAVYGF